MRHLLLIFGITLLIMTINSCGQNPEKDFPSRINTTLTEKHQRVLGTRVYLITSNQYTFVKELARYQKNENNYIQVIETSNSFVQAKPKLTRQVMEGKGATIKVYENIMLNDYEAIYAEGPSKNSGETQLMLIFGDETFMVMVVGLCKTDDKDGKEELKEIFKSIFYNKSLQVAPLELANFEFDQTITNYKYSTTASNFFFYTKNGKEDANKQTFNAIQIGAMPKMTDEEAENYFNNLLLNYENKGYIVDSKSFFKTKINDYPALTFETKIKIENQNGILYQVFLFGENSSVVYIATAVDSIETNLTKFKNTAETIKIK